MSCARVDDCSDLDVTPCTCARTHASEHEQNARWRPCIRSNKLKGTLSKTSVQKNAVSSVACFEAARFAGVRICCSSTGTVLFRRSMLPAIPCMIPFGIVCRRKHCDHRPNERQAVIASLHGEPSMPSGCFADLHSTQQSPVH